MFDTILGRKTRDEVEAEMHPNNFRAKYSKGANRIKTGGTANALPSLDNESDLFPCPPTKFQIFTV